MKRLCSYIKSTNTKTLYKNGYRCECAKTVWTDKTIYSITIFNKNNKCVDVFRTENKEKANDFYKEHILFS